MASFDTVPGESASALRNCHMLYVHCVSKENFVARLRGLSCVELICREVHISFVDKMVERRVALVPLANGRHNVDVLFASRNTTALVSLKTSCDLKFDDDSDPREAPFSAVLLWDFDLVPAPAAAFVHPKKILNSEDIDQTLPPLNLDVTTSCNCFDHKNRLCLANFNMHRDPEDEQEEEGIVDPLRELLVRTEDDDDDDDDENESDSDRDSESCDIEQEEQEQEQEHVEYFHFIGSNWEERYQKGLNKCYELRIKKERVQIRVEHEPDNIADCNALKFEVLADGNWLILGYCGVKKIPKLKKALNCAQVVSLDLCNLKRVWFPVISEFRFSAGLNIVKKGSWERDDPHNAYNSVIAI